MNAIMLQTYWRTGEYIVEYEQNGADKAKYGTSLIRCLARDLTLRPGNGFSRSNLQYMRKFYLVSQKSQTSGFLTWSHYLEILRICRHPGFRAIERGASSYGACRTSARLPT